MSENAFTLSKVLFISLPKESIVIFHHISAFIKGMSEHWPIRQAALVYLRQLKTFSIILIIYWCKRYMAHSRFENLLRSRVTENKEVKTIDRTNIIVTKQRKTSQVLTPR